MPVYDPFGPDRRPFHLATRLRPHVPEAGVAPTRFEGPTLPDPDPRNRPYWEAQYADWVRGQEARWEAAYGPWLLTQEVSP